MTTHHWVNFMQNSMTDEIIQGRVTESVILDRRANNLQLYRADFDKFKVRGYIFSDLTQALNASCVDGNPARLPCVFRACNMSLDHNEKNLGRFKNNWIVLSSTGTWLSGKSPMTTFEKAHQRWERYVMGSTHLSEDRIQENTERWCAFVAKMEARKNELIKQAKLERRDEIRREKKRLKQTAHIAGSW